MEVLYFNDITSQFDRPVVTLGTFDGVHCGHLEVLRTVKRSAAETGKASVVITFDLPPRVVLRPELPTRILTDLPEKAALIARTGIDYLIIIPFTTEFAALSPADFVSGYLVQQLNAGTVILGYDHLFGNGGSGGFELMQGFGKEFGFEVMQVAARQCSGTLVSSSLIRSLIQEGETEKAAGFLGYHYTVTGIVMHGKQLGRTLGFPTLNVEPLDPLKLMPGKGVYSLHAEIRGKRYKAMGNIGNRPTVQTEDPRLNLEVHVFNFDEDVYGEEVKIFFGHKIRDEIKFASLDQLKIQLETDKRVIQQ